MKPWISLMVALALAFGGVTAAAAPSLAQNAQARLRAVNASPDAPAMDVQVNGVTTFSNLAFRGVSQYATLSAGGVDVHFVATGTSQPPLIRVGVGLNPNSDHTVVAVGTLANIEPLVLTDDNRAPAPGQARVRFVNASPNAPAVDVAIAGGPVLFSNIAFIGVGDYISISAGTFNLELRQAGTSNVLLSVPNVMFSSCSVFTIFAVGLLNGQPPLQTVISTDAVTSCAVPTATPPVCVTATPTATGTPIRVVTATPSATVTASSTPSPVRSATPSATVTASSTPIPVVSATPSATVTATGTPSPVVSATPSATVTATGTLSPTLSATPSATVTATGTLSPTLSATPSAVVTATGTLSPTLSATPSAVVTATGTLTPIPSATPSSAATRTPTRAPSATRSAAPTAAATVAGVTPTTSRATPTGAPTSAASATKAPTTASTTPTQRAASRAGDWPASLR